MAALLWDDLLRLKFSHWSERRKTILLKVMGNYVLLSSSVSSDGLLALRCHWSNFRCVEQNQAV